jgi:hypothetical protein
MTFGVRWQAQRDTALDLQSPEIQKNVKRRRFALPAHSKGDSTCAMQPKWAGGRNI